MMYFTNIEISTKKHIAYLTEINLALGKPAYQSSTYNGATADR